MTWEEAQKTREKELAETDCGNREQTDIECPKCGKMIWRRTDIVLTSYPPKSIYECISCGWSETGY